MNTIQFNTRLQRFKSNRLSDYIEQRVKEVFQDEIFIEAGRQSPSRIAKSKPSKPTRPKRSTKKSTRKKAKLSTLTLLNIARTKVMLKEKVKYSASKNLLAAMDAKVDTRKPRSTFGQTTKDAVRDSFKGFDFIPDNNRLNRLKTGKR